MFWNKQLTLLPLIFILALAGVAAQDQRGGALTVRTRLHNEQIYFPGVPIEVLVTVENSGAEPARFRLADDRRYNLTFEVRTTTNTKVENSSEFTIARHTNQQIYYRTVVLAPGEQLSFVEELTAAVELTTPGEYRVQTLFYPELRHSHNGLTRLPTDNSAVSDQPLRSTSLTVTIRPGATTEIRAQQHMEAASSEVLSRARLSPDIVVERMITALQQAQWERFFLYLNLESLYRQAPERNRRFVRLSQQEQIEQILSYRAALIDGAEGGDVELVVRPDDYEIIETRYTPTQGHVITRLYFDNPTFRERRQYTYLFTRRAGVWEITGYEVSNLPNEALP